jgi:hypothetical protein
LQISSTCLFLDHHHHRLPHHLLGEIKRIKKKKTEKKQTKITVEKGKEVIITIGNNSNN